MKLYFSTIFDINYLSRGLLLLKTMREHHNDFSLFIVCLDEDVKAYFLKNKYEEVTLVTLSEIENEYPQLLSVKATRKKVDYIFTLSPFYPSYILTKNPQIPFICSLDADQYFFGSCESAFAALDQYSVLIMPHRFPERLKAAETFGKYNVSFQIFKNNETGNSCLSLWRKQCLEWCKDELEDGKFADQKYLDGWPERFGNEVGEIKDIGIGLAPWNLEGNKIEIKNGELLVGNQVLKLFHYQGLRFHSSKIIDSGLFCYFVRPQPGFKKYILSKIVRGLSTLQQNQKDSIIRNGISPNTKNVFEKINGHNYFYKQGNWLISLDAVFFIKRVKRYLWRKL